MGFLNRTFKHVYQFRLAGKVLKRWNRTVYCTVRYAIYAGLLAWIFV